MLPFAKPVRAILLLKRIDPGLSSPLRKKGIFREDEGMP
jgi:hypothetical protein